MIFSTATRRTENSSLPTNIETYCSTSCDSSGKTWKALFLRYRESSCVKRLMCPQSAHFQYLSAVGRPIHTSKADRFAGKGTVRRGRNNAFSKTTKPRPAFEIDGSARVSGHCLAKGFITRHRSVIPSVGRLVGHSVIQPVCRSVEKMVLGFQHIGSLVSGHLDFNRSVCPSIVRSSRSVSRPFGTTKIRTRFQRRFFVFARFCLWSVRTWG